MWGLSKGTLYHIYRVTQQCCPGGNRPETPRRPSAGGLRIFWAKSLVITAIYTNLSLIFVYMARITSDLTQKIRRPPAEGLRGVSGQFPPGQHCWSTRYLIFIYLFNFYPLAPQKVDIRTTIKFPSECFWYYCIP